MRTKTTPWASWEEWEQVRRWLEQGIDESGRPVGSGPSGEGGGRSDGALRKALVRIGAWRARGKVPVAVECTASLVETLLAEHESLRGSGGARRIGGVPVVSDAALRQLHGMAVVRFVNGIVDSGQRGMYAQSVAGVAARLGLPQWMVDVRHNATHNVMPGLAVLRRATAMAVSWLKHRYWDRQAYDLGILRGRLRQIMEDFEKESSKVIDGQGKATDKRYIKAASRFASLVSNRTLVRQFVPTWYATGYVLPPRSRSLEQHFAVWDPLLQSLHAQCPLFLAAMVIESCSRLESGDPYDTPADRLSDPDARRDTLQQQRVREHRSSNLKRKQPDAQRKAQPAVGSDRCETITTTPLHAATHGEVLEAWIQRWMGAKAESWHARQAMRKAACRVIRTARRVGGAAGIRLIASTTPHTPGAFTRITKAFLSAGPAAQSVLDTCTVDLESNGRGGVVDESEVGWAERVATLQELLRRRRTGAGLHEATVDGQGRAWSFSEQWSGQPLGSSSHLDDLIDEMDAPFTSERARGGTDAAGDEVPWLGIKRAQRGITNTDLERVQSLITIN